MPFFQKFIGPCPPRWSEFKSVLHELFPIIVDTKHIASHILGLDESNLEYLTGWVREKRLSGTEMISLQQEHFHDAGYDSLCTGVVFVGLLQLLKGKSSTSLNEYIDGLLRDGASPRIVNRLHAMQSDYPHFTLDSEDAVPDRSRVLYFGPLPGSLMEASLPISTDDIQITLARHLSNQEKEVHVIWINPTSFFIIFDDLECIRKLEPRAFEERALPRHDN